MDVMAYQSESGATFAYSAQSSWGIWVLLFPCSSTSNILTPLKWLFEGK